MCKVEKMPLRQSVKDFHRLCVHDHAANIVGMNDRQVDENFMEVHLKGTTLLITILDELLECLGYAKQLYPPEPLEPTDELWLEHGRRLDVITHLFLEVQVVQEALLCVGNSCTFTEEPKPNLN
jgi:hypothetical protein